MELVKSKRIFKKINTSDVYDVAEISPLTKASYLSKEVYNNVFLKREELQAVFSFKLRGAYNKIFKLKQKMEIKRVIAASAGNHAQGVAYSSRKLHLKATIFMPLTTPSIKVRAVKEMGAQVILSGDTYDEAYKHAVSFSKKSGYVFIHPFDDPEVIAGQGTVGKEILDQSKNLHHYSHRVFPFDNYLKLPMQLT